MAETKARLIRLTEAARQLGLGVKTLYIQADAGSIPAVRTPQNRLYIDQKWVDDQIAGNTQALVCPHCENEFKPGRYGAFLPEYLADKANAASADDSHLSLKGEIELVQTRINELLSRLQGHPDGASLGVLWKELSQSIKGYRSALGRSNLQAMAKHFEDIEKVTELGHRDYIIWDELGKLIRDVAKLRMGEHSRLVANQEIMTIERGQALISSVLGAIAEAAETVIDDDALRETLYDEFNDRFDRNVEAAELRQA